VLVLRHGQSEWNEQRRWQGRADSPLSDAGRAGAADLAARLGHHVDVDKGPLWTSPLARARETAEIVADHLGIGVIVDERLVERHAGAWQGLTTDAIDERWPGDRVAGRWPGDAESLDEVARRGRTAIMRVAAEHPAATTPVVITHGGLIRAVLQTAGGTDRRIANLEGTWLAVGPDRVLPGEAFPPERRSARQPGEDDDRL
jgi:probable phosphoglycerate mutase